MNSLNALQQEIHENKFYLRDILDKLNIHEKKIKNHPKVKQCLQKISRANWKIFRAAYG